MKHRDVVVKKEYRTKEGRVIPAGARLPVREVLKNGKEVIVVVDGTWVQIPSLYLK